MTSVSYPNQYRNYCVFDDRKINSLREQRERALPKIQSSLENPKNEDEVLENLYTLNLMLDDGVKGVDKLYPTLSKYNDTTSPNIQTFLAGIYRKTKIPDAFGPLVKMLIRNSIDSADKTNSSENIYPFDATEEIGGAILNYLA